MADEKKSAFTIASPLLTHWIDFFVPGIANYRNTLQEVLNLFQSNTDGSDLEAAHSPTNYTVSGGSSASISEHLGAIDDLFDVIDGGSY
jgi:hypothetical protein